MKKLLLFSLLSVVLCAKAIGQSIGTEIESNDIAANANLLVLGSYTANVALDTGCHMNTGSDIDFYKVNIPQGGVLNVTIPVNSTGIDFYIYIIDSATFTVINGRHSTTPVATETLICGGTYYIKVVNWSSMSSPYSYSLNATFYPDVTECNNTASTAYPVNPNDTVTAYLRGFNTPMGSYDIDYYKVRNVNCGFLTVNIPVSSTLTGFYISISDSATGTIVSSAHTSTAGAAITDTVSVPVGTYYIRIWPDIIISDPNPYTLYVNLSMCPSLMVNQVNEADENFSIFPNPNNGSFTVSSSSNNPQEMKITVTNIVGQKLQEISATTGQPTNINLNQPAGIYFINISTPTHNSTYKIIINR